MCSTFKVLAAAATLKRVDDKAEHLDRMIAYGAADLSDNTAANLLLREMGGPDSVTRLARALGDPVTRLDRNEPTLNEAAPGDPRDTTSPWATLGDMKILLFGNYLSPESRAQLNAWLAENTTGAKRLRAGLPADWQIGDKTGSGNATANDIAIITPPGRAPIVATVYLTEAKGSDADRSVAIQNVGRLIAELYR